MKRLKPLSIIIAFVVLLGGCGAQSAATSAEPLPSDDGATEITIEANDIWGFYQSAALKFEKETGVKVNVINDNTSGPDYQEKYFENLDRIKAELMAGKGADIYGYLYYDVTSIGQNGHLCNLADWIAADPTFSDETYYMNILESGFEKKNYYSVPLFMTFNALGAEVKVPELEGENLNWEEFFNLTKDVKRSGILYGLTDYQIFMRRFRDRYNSFIDEESETQNLNSPEMIRILKQCQEWSTQGLCVPLDAENFSQMTENTFFQEYGPGIEMLANISLSIPEAGGQHYLYDLPSDSGKSNKANKISAIDFICINAASPNKGTAWKFLKFLLSEDIQSTGHNTPVNRKAADEVISKTLTEDIEYYKPNTDPAEAIKETEAILNAVDKIEDIFQMNTDIEQIVFDEARRFFKHETSAEETAKNMSSTIDLYFKEQ